MAPYLDDFSSESVSDTVRLLTRKGSVTGCKLLSALDLLAGKYLLVAVVVVVLVDLE